jgi:hypothetical protein
MLMAQLSALIIYVWDTIHNINVPTSVTNFITMGMTYAISSLTHKQVSDTQNKTVSETAQITQPMTIIGKNE